MILLIVTCFNQKLLLPALPGKIAAIDDYLARQLVFNE
jgi:hypothetical protein